jgi:hypothetical protein
MKHYDNHVVISQDDREGTSIQKRTSENLNWEDESQWKELKWNSKYKRYHLTTDQAAKLFRDAEKS